MKKRRGENQVKPMNEKLGLPSLVYEHVFTTKDLYNHFLLRSSKKRRGIGRDDSVGQTTNPPDLGNFSSPVLCCQGGVSWILIKKSRNK